MARRVGSDVRGGSDEPYLVTFSSLVEPPSMFRVPAVACSWRRSQRGKPGVCRLIVRES
jgi:hypothetical protein